MTCLVTNTATTHTLHDYSRLFFCSLLWDLIKENLDPAELAANDFGKRSVGSEDTSHVVSQSTKTLSPATLSRTSLSVVGGWFLMHLKLVM